MSFAQFDLHPKIAEALQACGYTTPTPVQANSIPEILKGRDVVASAQTGTGKTAAFVVPALHKITQTPGVRKPRVLILTPTRELASQITKAASDYGKFLRFNIVSLVGGMPYRQQLRELSRPVDVIVATPGRLMDHMENHRLDLSAVEMLILDEADRMLDMGFIDDVKAIAKVTPDNRQTLLFSATVDNNLSTVIRQLLKDPVRIDLSHEKMAPTLIEQAIYLADDMKHKGQLLDHFLTNENIFKAIIFSATKINADNLADQLCDKGFAAAALHGDLKQSVRNRTIEQLRRGRIQFLVATDVAARGLDINDITHVINYDLPKFSEDYVHRIGRTGRAGKTGIAISFVLPMDTRNLNKIERYIGQRLTFATVAGLEPTKKGYSASKSDPKKKRFGKSSSSGRNDNRSSSFKRSDSDRPSYARSSEGRGNRSDAPRSYARSSEGRSERNDAPRSYARNSEGRSERSTPPRSYARTGEGRSERSDAPRSYARTGEGRSERSDAPRSYARNDRSEGNRSYNRNDSDRPSFNRSDRGDSNNRSSFARRGDNDRNTSFRRGDSEQRSSYRGNGESNRRGRGFAAKSFEDRDYHSEHKTNAYHADSKSSSAKEGSTKISYIKSRKSFRSGKSDSSSFKQNKKV